ncbi:endoribonuclease YbeY [Latimeria chalumnae]|uniref:YbeY metalloendoribonuclease n=1 Tax=Latimeria chalumnae TaxID=7897 RepID=H3AU13_LATCH|nr:PREDICTED: putative ribonuclease isoform X1 [Latimeria chalumnae]XP_005997735.1 PREDICTED: putative ribonuclease isoform X1 [Latimeria chalumnae]|eukprot:XP_005997734.1 PREDICTED: putative ribonuclease isoform X1 [Latimeria chalumnae]
MSLVLRNLQRTVSVRRSQLRRDIEIFRQILEVQQFDLGVICVDNRRVQRINNTYRQKDFPTDVLSFPFFEELKPGEVPQPLHQDEFSLGDIFLGVEYIYGQCQQQGEDFHSVLAVTAAHGLCHLLGYRHSTEAEWKQMFKKESQILEEYNRLTGANLQPLTKNKF